MSTDAPVDLRAALRQLNQEVGVPMDQLVRTVEQALALAYKRQFGSEGFVQARLDPEQGGLVMTATRTAEDGSQTVTELPVDDFRRSAAYTARKAVLGLLRGIERQQAQQAFSQRYGDTIPSRLTIPLHTGLTGTAAGQRRVLRVNDTLEDARNIKCDVGRNGTSEQESECIAVLSRLACVLGEVRVGGINSGCSLPER